MKIGVAPLWLAIALAIGSGGPAAAQSADDPAPDESEFETYADLHPYLSDEFSPGEGGEIGIDELIEGTDPETPIHEKPEYSGPSSKIRAKLDDLYRRTGLRLGFAGTALGLWANGADDPNGAAYDWDLTSAWTLVGRGTEDTGTLVVTVEYRGEIGSDPASAVGPQLGTLINTTNAFNDRGAVVRDAYWLQRFNDGKVRVLIGRADTSDFIGQQPMQNVNAMFVNRHVSGNASVPSPGHGPTVGVSYRPSDQFYVTGGVANGYNSTTESEFSSISDGDFFYGAEMGWTPELEGRGRGRYSIMLWRIDERRENGFNSPSDDGVTLVAGQQLSDRFQVWGRYSYADGGTTNIRTLVQTGLGYSGLFGSPSNMTGVTVSLAQPRAGASRDEKIVEAFQRLQVGRFTQLSAGLQLVFDPGNNPNENQAELFFVRLRHAF